MTELYLIAHKVCGELAFDVACRLQIGEEEGWIIPTSGWRAYPFWFTSLTNIRFYHEDEEGHRRGEFLDQIGPVPESLRDHFAALPEPSGGKITTLSLADLGL